MIKAVHLRVYQGERLSFDEAGRPQNSNQLVKLIYDVPQWHNYLSHIAISGLCKVEVEAYYEDSESKKTPQNIIDEVGMAYYGDAYESKPAKKAEPVEKAKPSNEDDDDKAEATAEYKEVLGKKPHHSWDVAKIREKIAEHKAQDDGNE